MEHTTLTTLSTESLQENQLATTCNVEAACETIHALARENLARRCYMAQVQKYSDERLPSETQTRLQEHF
eukprot:2580636-Amphidinium_carterae.2